MKAAIFHISYTYILQEVCFFFFLVHFSHSMYPSKHFGIHDKKSYRAGCLEGKGRVILLTFLSKPRVCNSSNENLIILLWHLCTFPVYVLTLLQVSNHYLENCRRSSETPTLLCHVYKAMFRSKLRYVSRNKKIIRVQWPLCRCPAYILTLMQVSNHYLENCRRSCGNTNPTMPGVQGNVSK